MEVGGESTELKTSLKLPNQGRDQFACFSKGGTGSFDRLGEQGIQRILGKSRSQVTRQILTVKWNR